jgi:hypothetical protein
MKGTAASAVPVLVIKSLRLIVFSCLKRLSEKINHIPIFAKIQPFGNVPSRIIDRSSCAVLQITFGDFCKAMMF